MRHNVSLLALALVLSATPLAAASPENGDAPIEPEFTGRLVPCCDNERDADPQWKSVTQRREVPGHALFDPETLARAKERAFAGLEDIPSARQLPELAAKALGVRTRFEGMNMLTSGHNGVIGFPPDTIVAASRSKVLEATNVALRLSNRAGEKEQIRSLNNFFSIAFPPLLFDPKVYYDRLSDRFFIVALSLDLRKRRSLIHLAVSRGPSPRSLVAPRDWCSYRISGKVSETWADYPGLGMNEKWLGIGVNNFTFISGNFSTAYVYALDKTRLVANAQSCPEIDSHRFRAGQEAFGSLAFTIQPAQHYSASGQPGSPLFFVSTQTVLRATRRYTLWRVRDDPAGGDRPQLSKAGVESAEFYVLPPDAPQRRGPVLDTGDTRVQQAAFRDGVVWAVHATSCNFGGTPSESCVRVLGITPSDSGGSVTFEETFGGGPDWFVWMPGIAVNARGDLGVAFQRSHPTQSVGMGFAGKPAASSGFERVTRLENGHCGIDDFDGNTNRTGDYVGIQTDPLDNESFWIAGEYSAQVRRLGCEWRTLIALVGF